MRRGFTLIEVIIVVAVIGIAAAVAVPGIVEMAGRAEGDRAVRESATAVAAARDAARGQGACLDYVQRPAPPNPGPYVVDVFRVACPGDNPFEPQKLLTRVLSPRITRATVTVDPSGTPRVVDRVHFHRDGSLYNPVATVAVDAVVDGRERRFRIYPAAGTIELDEAAQ